MVVAITSLGVQEFANCVDVLVSASAYDPHVRATTIGCPVFKTLVATGVLVLAGCGPEPSEVRMAVGDTLTGARGAEGTYISWREHIIDDLEAGGVAIAGSDGLQMADLDLDGFEDIVSVHESDTEYDGVADGHIRLAFGSEDPDSWTLVTLAEGSEAGAAEDASIADVNGDGYPDIIAACEFEHLIYFQNPGKDARTARWERIIPSSASGRGSYIRVFFADFNGDGKPEVVAPNKGSQSGPSTETERRAISWYEIDGDPLDDGSWREHELTRVAVPINSRPVDLDQDGDLDVLAASRAEARIFWFENRGGPEIEFQEHRIEIAVPEDYGDVRVTGFMFAFMDMNADSRLDIILSGNRSELVWLEQPETPVEPWNLHLLGSMAPDSATGITVADIDGDGRDDIFCGSYSRGPRDSDSDEVTADMPLGRLAWFENPGAAEGSWQRHDISRRKRGMFDMAIPRDMDSDGDIDFVGTRGNSDPWDGVYWLEQVRNDAPVPSFARARAVDSPEMPLP